MTTEKIAIIGGAGELGFGLALRWAKAGEDVILGSRDATKAKEDNADPSNRMDYGQVPGEPQSFNCPQIKGEQPKSSDHK